MAQLNPDGTVVLLPSRDGRQYMPNDPQGRERFYYWDSRDGQSCPRCGRSSFGAANEGMPEADFCDRCSEYRGLHPIEGDCETFVEPSGDAQIPR